MTPSRKKRAHSRRRAAHPVVGRVECLDGLSDCLKTIGVLADLLAAAGRHPNARPVEAGTVSHTGKLILAEVAKAEAWLDKLEGAR